MIGEYSNRTKFLLKKYEELTNLLHMTDMDSLSNPHYSTLKIKLTTGKKLRFVYVDDNEWSIETEKFWERRTK